MGEFAVELIEVTKTFPGVRGSPGVTAVDHMDLTIHHGEFFTLLGPSGCGKTTTLRMIAGFEAPSSGMLRIDGQEMARVPPNRRPVNTVFQNYALFPHLTVEKNVSFGLKIKRVPKAEWQQRVHEALELVRLPGMENRRPSQLSGGQQQRVALARALVNRPAVLLLDEPLGALDLKLRKAVQLELKHLQAQLGISFVYVTHDQEEALTMSDRIAVMSDGLIQQIGTPREIYENPVNRFVADFIGETNFIDGRVESAGAVVKVESGGLSLIGRGGEGYLEGGQPITLAIRPEKINLYAPGHADVLETETGLEAEHVQRILGVQLLNARMDMRDYLESESNSIVLDGVVTEAVYIGTDIRYLVRLPNEHEIVVRMQNFGERYDTQFEAGDQVLIHWAAENARVLVE